MIALYLFLKEVLSIIHAIKYACYKMANVILIQIIGKMKKVIKRFTEAAEPMLPAVPNR